MALSIPPLLDLPVIGENKDLPDEEKGDYGTESKGCICVGVQFQGVIHRDE